MAKKLILNSLLLFSLSFSVLAQTNDDKPSVNYYRHSVGVNFSNDVSSQIENYPQSGTYAGFDLSYEYEPQYGYSAALLYQYRPADWFSVETGLEYNSTKYHQDFIHSNPMNCWDGEEYSPNIYCLYDVTSRRERLAVPLNLRWYYQKNNWGIYALTGLVFNFDTRTTDKYLVADRGETEKVIGSYSADTTFGLGVSAGLGFEYLLGKNFVLRAEPRFRLYDVARPHRPTFYYYDHETEYKEMHWAFGLNLGIYYGFGAK